MTNEEKLRETFPNTIFIFRKNGNNETVAIMVSDEWLQGDYDQMYKDAEPCDRLKLDGMLEDAYEHGYQQARYDYEVQPCEDAIDRQALRARFNHLDEVYEGMSEEEKHEAYIYGQIIRAIDDAPTVIPATEEKSCATCGQPRNDAGDCILFMERKCVARYEKWISATKEGAE